MRFLHIRFAKLSVVEITNNCIFVFNNSNAAFSGAEQIEQQPFLPEAAAL